MKLKKSISTLCAAAMILSAFSFANAAAPQNEISENAGQTIRCQVVESTKDGLKSRMIDVYIPEGATEAEVTQLVNNAALGGTARSVQAIDELGVMQETTIPVSRDGMVLAHDTLNITCKRIVAQFSVSTHGPLASLWVKCSNFTTDESTGWERVIFTEYPQRVVFFASDIQMNKDDEIEVRGRCEVSPITTSVVYVAGTTVE